MYCTRCGHEVKEGQKFCTQCGNQIVFTGNSHTDKENMPRRCGQKYEEISKRYHKLRIIMLVCMAVAVLCIVIVAFFLLRSGNIVKEFDFFTPNDKMYYTEPEEDDITYDKENGAKYVNNELILTAEEGVSKKEVEALIREYDAKLIGYIAGTNTYQIRFNQGYSYKDLDRLGNRICMDKKIEYFEINRLLHIDVEAYPDDTEWAESWGENPEGSNWGLEAIRAPKAWEYFDQMEPVNIGVYDTIFRRHEDITFESVIGIDDSREKISSNHGTNVAGIIGATYNNGKGICGVFPKAKLYGMSYIRQGELTKEFSNMSLKIGLTYLINIEKCKVINMSFGRDELCYGASRGNQYAIDELRTDAGILGKYLKILLDGGDDFVICTAAGNLNSLDSIDNYEFIRADQDDLDAPYGYIIYDEDNKERYEKYENQEDFSERIEYGNVDAAYDVLAAITEPSIKERIIVVGAVQNDGNDNYSVCNFSCCGSRVDVTAPGKWIRSTSHEVKNGKVVDSYTGGIGENPSLQGTSEASPFVAGVAAMLFSVNRDLRGSEVKQIICNSTNKMVKYSGIMADAMKKYTYPMLNAELAVKEAIRRGNVRKEAADSNQNDSIDIESAYAKYKALVLGYEEKYGKVGLYRPDEWRTYLTGLCFAKLVDFNQDGLEELLLVYAMGDLQSGSLLYDYTYEVWEYRYDNINLIDTGKLFGTNGGVQTVLFADYKGQTYLLTGGSDSFSYNYYHGYRGTEFGVIRTAICEDLFDQSAACSIDDQEVSYEQWEKEENLWKANLEEYCLNSNDEDVSKARGVLEETREKLGIENEVENIQISSDSTSSTLYNNWSEAYNDILLQYYHVIHDQETTQHSDLSIVNYMLYREHDSEYQCSFSIADIDENGIPELLIGSADSILDIYTWQEGKIIRLLEQPTERSNLSLRADGILDLDGSGGAASHYCSYFEIRDDGKSCDLFEYYHIEGDNTGKSSTITVEKVNGEIETFLRGEISFDAYSHIYPMASLQCEVLNLENIRAATGIYESCNASLTARAVVLSPYFRMGLCENYLEVLENHYFRTQSADEYDDLDIVWNFEEWAGKKVIEITINEKETGKIRYLDTLDRETCEVIEIEQNTGMENRFSLFP